ncbi:MAG: twin-arginine translocation signal domain-containing protein [Faecalibacterium sp.]|nr:twin-arginine translocation signal domain-containing protein [Faecalibacterium sp.]
MMKKISRRSFLQVCGITAATAALTACGGGKTETAKKDDTPPSAGQIPHGAE